jgi:hypothetical protein
VAGSFVGSGSEEALTEHPVNITQETAIKITSSITIVLRNTFIFITSLFLRYDTSIIAQKSIKIKRWGPKTPQND